MGTNYYLERKVGYDFIGEMFGIEPDRIHIGKYSNGWAFSFRCHEGAAESFHEWRGVIGEALINDWELVDEYGATFTLDAFVKMVESSKDGRRPGQRSFVDQYRDRDNWPFYRGEFC